MLTEPFVPPVLQASCYDLYDMISVCADEESGAGSSDGKNPGGRSSAYHEDPDDPDMA